MVSNRPGFVVGSDIGGSNLRVARRRPVRRADLRPQAADHQGRRPRGLGMQVLEMVTEVDRPRRRDARPAARAGDLDARDHRPEQPAGHLAGVQRQPRGRLRPARGDPRSPRNARAGGEQRQPGGRRREVVGLARGVSTMVFVSVGAGIGMGIVIDDEVVRGAHGAAGEIGYLPPAGDPFDPRHRLHGGLEDEIGAAGIVAAFNAGRARRPRAVLRTRGVRARAHQGNAAARAVVDHVAARLGTAIAAVCAILDPELVVLGGGIGSNPLLLSPRARRRRRAGADHRADRDEPAGRQGGAARSDRRGAAGRARPGVVAGRRGRKRDERARSSRPVTSARYPRTSAESDRTRSSRSPSATATGRVAVRERRPRDRRRRVHGARRAVRLRQDDAAADDRRARGRSPRATIAIGDRVVNDLDARRTATSRWSSRTTRSTRT